GAGQGRKSTAPKNHARRSTAGGVGSRGDKSSSSDLWPSCRRASTFVGGPFSWRALPHQSLGDAGQGLRNETSARNLSHCLDRLFPRVGFRSIGRPGVGDDPGESPESRKRSKKGCSVRDPELLRWGV